MANAIFKLSLVSVSQSAIEHLGFSYVGRLSTETCTTWFVTTGQDVLPSVFDECGIPLDWLTIEANLKTNGGVTMNFLADVTAAENAIRQLQQIELANRTVFPPTLPKVSVVFDPTYPRCGNE